MDIEKSLYMTDFLKMREDLGTMELYSAKNILYENLYDKLKPKEQIEEIEEVIEEIQDKSIHLLKKDDQSAFFPDLPNLEEVKPVEEDIKHIKVSEKVDMKGGNSTIKTISISPHYVVSD